ncbi:MAG: MFS transporter [Gordonia sp. (in: high G+C Gram-positive bacteria)]
MSVVDSSKFPRSLALLGAAALFAEILDGTIVVTALPAIARGFGVPAVAASSVVTAYLITLSVLIPLSSWVAERFGIRRVFVCALVVFTVASAGCALASGLTVLMVMRVIQAAGGAMMVPVGRLAVLRAVDVGYLARAIAYLTWPALVAPVVAPLAGGLIVEHIGWRFIFAINVPIGFIGVIVALRIRMPPNAVVRRRLDVAGALGVMTSVAAAMIAATELTATPVRWRVALGAAGAAAVIGVVTIAHLRRAANPLLNLSVLRVSSFASVVGFGTAYRLAISAMPFVVPLMLQLRFGWSPVTAGAMVTSLFAGNIMIKPLTTPMMRRWGIRRVLVVVGISSAVAFALFAMVGPATSPVLIAVLLWISGVLRSVGFSAYNTLAFADVGAERLGDANALHAAVQELGSAGGVALASVAIAVLDSVPVLAAGGYSVVYLCLAVVMLACAYGAGLLRSSVGAQALR